MFAVVAPHPCSHPSPAELAEMLSELRRVEERLQPFIQRAHGILETAAAAEYNNDTVMQHPGITRRSVAVMFVLA